MERRNFFKNIFGAGVIIAVAPQSLLSNEQPIVEVAKETKQVNHTIKKVVATLKKDGDIYAYCTGRVELSTSVEKIDITTRDDVRNFKPTQYIAGRQTTTLTMQNIVFTKGLDFDFAEASYDVFEFTMENEDVRFHAEDVYLMNLEMGSTFDAPITWTANLRLSGKMTIEPLKQ